jgi:ferric-dicitrate binding protein FerR (iron transport regulator)
MNLKDKQHTESLLKRLLSYKSSSVDRREWNEHSSMKRTLKEDWDHSSDINMGEWNDEKVLRRIMNVIHSPKLYHSDNHFYRLGWVAAVVMLIVSSALTSILLFPTSQQQEPNIVCQLMSGKQMMEKVTLADGTVVTLSARSCLTYPKQFTGDTREVKLTGRAFFNVHHDAQHPFVVQTNRFDVTALGTAFEVIEYGNEKATEATLLNGKIKVDIKGRKAKNSFVLLPDERICCNATGIHIETVDADRATAWRNGRRLQFINERLSDIIPQITRWYGKTILCSKEISKKYRFTFSIKDEPIELIMQNIKMSNPSLTYRVINSQTYLIEYK